MRRRPFIGVGQIVSLAAVLLVVLAAACGGDSGDAEAPAAPADVGAGTGESDAAVSEGAADGSLSLPQLDRKIIRTARLELQVEKVSAAVTEVEDIAEAAGGWVSASNVFVDQPSGSDDGDDGTARRTETATVTIRVPADAYRSVVGQLRGMAEQVRSESSEASEVTEEYTDLQARLRNQEATEAQLLELLAKAETIPDILTVQEKVSQVRLEIETVQGRINVLDSLTSMATITVELEEFVAAAASDDQGWAADAWDAAWEGSQTATVVLGSVAIVGGVVLAWLAVPALVIVAVWWRFGKRISRVLGLPSEDTGPTGPPA